MRTKIILSFLLFSSLNALAQNVTHSPFSSFGFGERTYGNDAVTSALGKANIALADSMFLNFHNPATYHLLAEGQPLFSLSAASRLSTYSQNNSSVFRATGMIDHFAFGFSIKKLFGLTIGLKPYSNRGYDITSSIKVGSDSVRYNYEGVGGTNEAFLGLTSTLLKWKGAHLSVGANLGYLFGTATNIRKSSIIQSNAFNGGVDEKAMRFKSIHYELGAYYKQNITPLQTLSLSAVLEPSQQINAFQSETLYDAGNVNNQLTYSMLYDTSNVQGNITLAPTYSLGFAYSFRTSAQNNSKYTRNSEWMLTGSYSSTDWSKYRTAFNSVEISYSYSATSKISIGFQYTPETKFIENSVNTNLFERMRYRVGYYNFSLPYTDNGLSTSEFGTTFGLGLPIVAQQALSSVNIGVTYGKRGNADASGLNETFVGINFGVIISPSFYDRWFRKRKLD